LLSVWAWVAIGSQSVGWYCGNIGSLGAVHPRLNSSAAILITTAPPLRSTVRSKPGV